MSRSWEVRVSIAAVAQWIRSLPRVDPLVAFRPTDQNPSSKAGDNSLVLEADERADRLSCDMRFTQPFSTPFEARGQTRDVGSRYTEKTQTNTDKLRALRHAAIMSETPVRVGYAPLSRNAHLAEWL